MKRKTNISVQDNRGIRVTSNMMVGEKFNGYASGDILDANSIVELILQLIGNGIIHSDAITSESIKDGSINVEDLSDDVKNLLSSGTTFQYADETMEIINSNNN